MRIGMMADTYKPYISGITNYIALNKRYLEKAGHEVYIFTFGNLDYEDDETRIIRSPGKALIDTGFYMSLRYSREAKKMLQRMDIVHVHHPLLSGLLALRYCRPHKIPVIFTNHTRYDLYAQAYMPLLPEIISDSLLKAYMPSYCNAVDRVVSPSPGMEKILRKLDVEAHVEVVPNGVEIARFRQAEALSRADFGFSDDDILLIYAGRLAPEKNLSFLLAAFNGVAEALENVHLLLLGSGPSTEKIKDEIEELENGQNIHIIGRIDYNKMPGYLRMCDAFVTASISEVHPLSVIEAMGAKLPVMGIHSPGVGDTVEDKKNGFLSTENLPAFTAKLTRLCVDKELREKMGENARETSALYSIQRTTEMMTDLYKNVIKDTRPHDDMHETTLRKIVERILP